MQDVGIFRIKIKNPGVQHRALLKRSPDRPVQTIL